MSKTYCIVVAAGSGSRFGASLPKQFCDLLGRPVVMETIDRLRAALPTDSELVLVISESMQNLWQELCERHSFDSPRIVYGGSSRYESVKNALTILPEDTSRTSVAMVHDAARPIVTRAVIDSLIHALADGAIGAVPAIDVTDSMRRIDSEGRWIAVDRADFRAIQTPQAFPLYILKESYARPYSPDLTDDASVVEAAGHTDIRIVAGDPRTLKITHPADIATVSFYLSENG